MGAGCLGGDGEALGDFGVIKLFEGVKLEHFQGHPGEMDESLAADGIGDVRALDGVDGRQGRFGGSRAVVDEYPPELALAQQVNADVAQGGEEKRPFLLGGGIGLPVLPGAYEQLLEGVFDILFLDEVFPGHRAEEGAVTQEYRCLGVFVH